MAANPSASNANNTTVVDGNESSYRFSLIALTTLFFMWGFITCLNDILIPYLKGVFSLNYTQAMLVQFCFFGAYFIVSVPAGRLVTKVGYKKGIVVGLIIAGIGCGLFYPAAELRVYTIFLLALFVLASGITVLQVAANPYVTILGKAETASSRLTLTQAFNSMGTTIAPFFGALLILGVATSGADTSSMNAAEVAALHNTQAAAVQLPYLGLALAFIAIAVVFAKLNLPAVTSSDDEIERSDSESVWSQRHLVLGAVAIFVYVGAEVSIGSFLVNFLGEKNIAGMEEATAAQYIAYYWGGAMVGRFIGSAVMRYVSAGKVLAFNALMACILVAMAMSLSGAIAMWAILLVGLFNSIMFPTIFSLAVSRLGNLTSQGSGVLCLAIVGGAILPLLQGMLADLMGIQLAFFLPILCYLYIAYYGVQGSKPQG
jgi:FHS family L-fucose permease-like MFS transporter